MNGCYVSGRFVYVSFHQKQFGNPSKIYCLRIYRVTLYTIAYWTPVDAQIEINGRTSCSAIEAPMIYDYPSSPPTNIMNVRICHEHTHCPIK